jgi:predicted phage baseplate assembly protein
MPLPVPNLDDRKFQDILDEARRLIPRYCPEWTDHNLSDPGITLLELFAWMTDMTLYRLNRVPEKNYLKFLDLIGVAREPAHPATADVTFRLTAPQPQDIVIPRGTEVATVRTEAHEAVPFATERDLVIRIPRLAHVLACRAGAQFHDYREALEDPDQELALFSDVPRPDDALYLGFTTDLAGNTLLVRLQCAMAGIGIDPTDPPLVWEAFDRTELQWTPVTVHEDTTQGLNGDGYVIADVPYSAGVTAVDNKPAFWLRCRVAPPLPGQPAYVTSPRVTGVEVESIGGLVPARHSMRIDVEALGTSDGTPGQTFTLSRFPVLPRRPGETLEVENDEGEFEPWTEVTDFGSSTERDGHFMVDDASGTVTLGPLIRSPGGRDHQYGKVPPAGRALRFSRYWSGGGLVGNVGAQTITVLKTAIPYVAWVTNYTPSLGGTESEDIEHVKMRGPRTLRTRERAVTPQDFEALALEASPAVARARCQVIGGLVSTVEESDLDDMESLLANGAFGAGGAGGAGGHGANGANGSNGANGAGSDELGRLLSPFAGLRHTNGAGGGHGAPGGRIAQRAVTQAPPAAGFIRLLIVPALHDISGAISPQQLQLTPRVRREVHDYLDDRRLVTCELVLGTPTYTWVSVAARVRAIPTYDRGLVALRAQQALNRYIHPVLGGPEGNGWPFSRELYLGEVYSILQQVEGIQVIEEVSLYHVDPNNGASGPPTTRISPGAGGILVSHEHRIMVQ